MTKYRDTNTFFILSLSFIAIISICLSLVRLDIIPQDISSDILLYFTNARAIAETGKDIYDHVFPLYFIHKGIIAMPVTVYVIAFFYKIFGSAHIVGYFPNVLISAVSIILIGFFATHLTGNKRIGIFAALSLLISPWHYHLSRTGFEGVFGFSLVFAGIYCSILGLKKPAYLLWSVLLFAIATFSYKAVNIFVLFYPLALLCKSGWNFIKTKQFILYSLSIWFIIFFQWFLLVFLYHDTYANGIITNNIDIARKTVETQMNESDAPRKVKLLMSNVPLALGKIMISNYVHFFSPQFLLTTGDTDNRFSTTGHGQLYYLDLIFIIAGILWLLKNSSDRTLPFLLSIIAIAPISSLISDQQYAIRTYATVFIFSTLVAIGLESIIKKKLILLPIVTCIYAILFAAYLYQYHFLYIHYGRWIWGGTTRDVYIEAYKSSGNYDAITFGKTSEFEYLHFMYWNHLPMKDIQKTLPSYNERELSYKNIHFIRTCNYSGNDPADDAISQKEFVYVRDDCYGSIEPIHKYYLPKSLLYSWKSYDYKTFAAYYNTIHQ